MFCRWLELAKEFDIVQRYECGILTHRGQSKTPVPVMEDDILENYLRQHPDIVLSSSTLTEAYEAVVFREELQNDIFTVFLAPPKDEPFQTSALLFDLERQTFMDHEYVLHFLQVCIR